MDPVQEGLQPEKNHRIYQKYLLLKCKCSKSGELRDAIKILFCEQFENSG